MIVDYNIRMKPYLIPRDEFDHKQLQGFGFSSSNRSTVVQHGVESQYHHLGSADTCSQPSLPSGPPELAVPLTDDPADSTCTWPVYLWSQWISLWASICNLNTLRRPVVSGKQMGILPLPSLPPEPKICLGAKLKWRAWLLIYWNLVVGVLLTWIQVTHPGKVIWLRNWYEEMYTCLRWNLEVDGLPDSIAFCAWFLIYPSGERTSSSCPVRSIPAYHHTA